MMAAPLYLVIERNTMLGTARAIGQPRTYPEAVAHAQAMMPDPDRTRAFVSYIVRPVNGRSADDVVIRQGRG
jgi:hypothetical protein